MLSTRERAGLKGRALVDGLAVTVLLRHELPDGGGHLDWLLERPARPDLGLLSFRVRGRIDDPRIGRFGATRLPDHRRLYLEYEGPISGGRGTVVRVVSGHCLRCEEGEGHVLIAVEFGGHVQTLEGIQRSGAEWVFEPVTEQKHEDQGVRPR